MSSTARPAPLGRWDFWRTARAAAAVVVVMTALYYLVVAFSNISYPASNWPFVQGVLSGDGTPPDNGYEWRELHAPWLHVAAYVLIIAGETVAGLVLAAAGIAGLARTADHARWLAVQRFAVLGCLVGLGVFYLGFLTIGGNWFIMYLNEEWNGMQPAFQNSVMTVATLAVVVLVGIGGGRRAPAPDDPG